MRPQRPVHPQPAWSVFGPGPIPPQAAPTNGSPFGGPPTPHHTCRADLPRRSLAWAGVKAKADGTWLADFQLLIGAASTPLRPPVLAEFNDKVMVGPRLCKSWFSRRASAPITAAPRISLRTPRAQFRERWRRRMVAERQRTLARHASVWSRAKRIHASWRDTGFARRPATHFNVIFVSRRNASSKDKSRPLFNANTNDFDPVPDVVSTVRTRHD